MPLSQRRAAQDWGVSRARLQRAIKAGKLSPMPGGNIDPAEMLRVFGDPESRTRSSQTTPIVPGDDPAEKARLKAEIEGLRALLAAKDANLSDLRDQVQRLTHAPARRSWWPWGKA